MGKALRLSEKWFRRGLWLVALVFAGFLIGLGGTIVGDLPKVEAPLRVDDFLDRTAAQALRSQVKEAHQAEQDAQAALEQARLRHARARSATQAGSPLAPPPDNPALARNCSGCLKGSSMAEACSCKFSAFHATVPPGRLASTQSTVASCTPRRASRTCQGDSCTPAVGGVLTLASSTG